MNSQNHEKQPLSIILFFEQTVKNWLFISNIQIRKQRMISNVKSSNGPKQLFIFKLKFSEIDRSTFTYSIIHIYVEYLDVFMETWLR